MSEPPKASTSSSGADKLTVAGRPEPGVWLLEEYKLLSGHYFHESVQMIQTTTVYCTLNSGLLAFMASQFAATTATAKLLLPIVGLVSCLSWLTSLVRLREWRDYAEMRIEEIEHALHTAWGDLDPLPLDIRTARRWDTWAPDRRWFNWPYRKLREIPSSLAHLTLPAIFAGVWIMVLILGASQIRR